MSMMKLLQRLLAFFFSSRRRHTRLQGDWSSDVCSSDLPGRPRGAEAGRATPSLRAPPAHDPCRLLDQVAAPQIGRASCRERGEKEVGDVGYSKKKWCTWS